MNALILFFFAVVLLGQCVLANNINAPYLREKMAAISNEDVIDHGGLRAKRQLFGEYDIHDINDQIMQRTQYKNEHGGPCKVPGVNGVCTFYMNCGIVRKPGFNPLKAAFQDTCMILSDICCPANEISNL